jgi:hypothetical protein
VHIHGIGEFKRTGRVVAIEHEKWLIQDDEGRVVQVRCDTPNYLHVRIGDKVEFEPKYQSTAAFRLSWSVVRVLPTPDDA